MIEMLVSDLIEREGGFVNHPDDTGGATNMGITLLTLSNWRNWDCTTDDIENLTYEEASDIYLSEYWDEPKLSNLNVELVVLEMLFDAAVHHGPARSIKLLQKAAGVTTDGVIGPQTRAAVNQIDPVKLAAYLIAARVAYIGSIITASPKQAAFAAGWANRMEEMIKKIAEI